jgi:hypothetical protein
MKKIIPLSLALALLFTWGAVRAVDSNTDPLPAELAKPAVDQARMDILRSLTAAVKPEATKQYVPGTRRPINLPLFSMPLQRSLILTDWLFDDFEDGDYDGWTNVSNGDGDGDEDWAIHTDPWSYVGGDVENHGTGFMVGSDAAGGGYQATTDEEISIDFPTPVGTQLYLEYWLYFRAYSFATDYFEVLIDGEQIDLVTAPNDIPIEGVRSVIIDEYADGNTHTLTMHYYAYWGYACAFDDVIINDNPCEVTCPPGGIPEGEPDCFDGSVDEYNTGCNADPPLEPIWSEISCDDTICGKAGAFLVDPDDPEGPVARDTDWYRFYVTEPSVVEMGAVAEFPLQLLFFDRTVSCDDYNYTGGSVGRCDTMRITETLLPGEYWLWAGSSTFPPDLEEGIDCDGLGRLGNDYVMWVVCTPTPPCNAETVIGDINSELPYSDIGQTTCGAGNDWDETCLGAYDGGEDFVYEFTVSEFITLDITLDPHGSRFTGILVDDFCPPNPDECLAISTSSSNVPHGFESMMFQPGPYWIMVDTDPFPDCIPEFDLTIEEGMLTLGVGETENIPDCGISNYGPLGDPDYQLEGTYNWNDNFPSNYGGTFVMGDGPARMFSHYNFGVSDCLPYRGTVGLNLSDPFHPTCAYDDDGAMGGVDIDYKGIGFPPPAGPAGDIFIHVFTITNNSGGTISDYYAGVYFDWDIGYPSNDPDTVEFQRDHSLMYQGLMDLSYIMGLCLINDDEANLRSMTAVSQSDYIYSGGWDMADLHMLMSFDGDQIADEWYDDMSSLFSTGPHTLNNGESVTLEIAVIGANNHDDMIARAALIGQADIEDGVVVGPTGACCDDATGTCDDDVFILDCAGTRFAANTLCDNLEPLCGEVSGCDYLAGDPNCNNIPAELPDVIAMIGMYRGSVAHCYECPCPPHGDNFAPSADPNGNCISDELPDVVAMIGIYRGTVVAAGCSACPPQGRIAPGGIVPSLKSKAKATLQSVD